MSPGSACGLEGVAVGTGKGQVTIRSPTVGLRLATAALACALLTSTLRLFERTLPPGVDFAVTFHPFTLAWLRGEVSTYDLAAGYAFHNTPWSLVLLIPLSLLPERLGLALLMLLSLAMIMLSALLMHHPNKLPIWVLLLCLFNLHTLDLIIGGQFDAFTLLGIAVGWRGLRERKAWLVCLSLWPLTMKPLNAFPVVLLFLWGIRSWSKKQIAVALSATTVSVLAAGLVIGFDWPLRYMRFSHTFPPTAHISISLWRAASLSQLPFWFVLVLCTDLSGLLVILVKRRGPTRHALSATLATTFMITPYANGNNYILLIPAFTSTVELSPVLGLLAYAATFLPLARLVWGNSASSLDTLYPLSLLVSTWALIVRKPSGARVIVQAGAVPARPEVQMSV